MLPKNSTVYDCIIVGAGLAGLMAARNLHRSGHNVLVIEAQERFGGRMYGRYLPSGQWIARMAVVLTQFFSILPIKDFVDNVPLQRRLVTFASPPRDLPTVRCKGVVCDSFILNE